MNAEHAKKMLIKGPMKVLIMNAPPEYTTDLEALPTGSAATVWEPQAGPFPAQGGEFDFVQLFASSRAELEEFANSAIRAVKRDGLLWITYPKKSGKIKTDLTRDQGWDAVHNEGYTGVSLISIDDTWSAMRARPVDQIPALQRQFEKVTEDQKVVRVQAESVMSGGGKKEKTRVVEVPDDFRSALEDSPAAKALFDSIAYTHKKEYVNWITEAKRADTRESRIAKAVEMLESGKKSRMQK